MILLAHRGLDKGVLPDSGESTLTSFKSCVQRGFGFEFDLQITADRKLVVCHDVDLSRITQDSIAIKNLTLEELRKRVPTICDVRSLIPLIKQAPLAALHWKNDNQNLYFAETLAEFLIQCPEAHQRLLVFDIHPVWGEWLFEHYPKLNLALSVAHPSDIQRFGAVTGDTLYNLEQALQWRAVGKWVWLDEWDLMDLNGGEKRLYHAELFKELNAAGIKSAVISPDLHRDHPEGKSIQLLKKSWKSIAGFQPDALCTDFPSQWRASA